MHETSFLNDTLFWYAVAVVIFLAFAIAKLRGPILGWLDGEIAKVLAELSEAKRLHAEAQATLDDYRNRQKDAAREAELIVSEAKQDAARLQVEAEADLKAALDRHEQLFLDRLKLAHEEAIDEVRAYVIEEALVEARGKIARIADSPEASTLMDHIIAELPKLAKKKTA